MADRKSAPDSLSPAYFKAKANYEDADRYYRGQNELDQRCLDFLFKQEHYANDPGVTLDDALIAPKGTEINDQWRYKKSRILADGVYIESHPRDQQTDPLASESATQVLRSIIEDGTNRYEAARDRWVGGGLATGTWYIMAHWNPRRGPMGDIVFETMGADRCMPCPGYLDLHDPCNPYVVIVRDEPIDSVQAKGGDGEYEWKNTANLWPDCNGRYSSEEDYNKAHASPSTDDLYLPKTVRVVYVLYRDSDETYNKDAGYRDLPKDRQYMACPTCGYSDHNHETMPDGSLPEVGAACPECLAKYMDGQAENPSYLQRIRREKLTEQRLKYPKGKLCIIAPRQGREFYIGPWQAECRSFPIGQFRAYESPYEQKGGCDTLLYWSQQALMDALRKQFYDQVALSTPKVIINRQADGRPALTDASGREANLTNANDQVLHFEGQPGLPIQSSIWQYQGQGPPASFFNTFQILQSGFYQTRGVGQVQFGPGQSKDVAFKSLQLQHETGDIPVDDHKRVLQREEGLFLGCVLDIWVANATQQRVVRYFGPDGAANFRWLQGSDIPNVDVVVGAPPRIRQGSIDELNTLLTYSQIENPALRQIAAQRLNLSPSEIQKVEAGMPQQPPAGPGGAVQQQGSQVASFPAAQGAQQPIA